jgi:hypothetical protein
MTILKLRQANNPESTTKLAYIRELAASIDDLKRIDKISNDRINF